MGKISIPVQRCEAEAGRPGNFHACRSLATYAARQFGEPTLYYCDDHKWHVDDRQFTAPGRVLSPLVAPGIGPYEEALRRRLGIE